MVSYNPINCFSAYTFALFALSSLTTEPIIGLLLFAFGIFLALVTLVAYVEILPLFAVATCAINLYFLFKSKFIPEVFLVVVILAAFVYVAYFVVTYDAFADDYLYEWLGGKLFCLPSYPCYKFGVKITKVVGDELEEFHSYVDTPLGSICSGRYAYVRTDSIKNFESVNLEGWYSGSNPDIVLKDYDKNINVWMLGRVDKYF